MKQIEATNSRPYYSVSYQYTHNPWTLWSCNRFGPTDSTMQGTDSLELAKSTADDLVKQPGICLAMVHKSLDCYNHKQVYEVKSGTMKKGSATLASSDFPSYRTPTNVANRLS